MQAPGLAYAYAWCLHRVKGWGDGLQDLHGSRANAVYPDLQKVMIPGRPPNGVFLREVCHLACLGNILDSHGLASPGAPRPHGRCDISFPWGDISPAS